MSLASRRLILTSFLAGTVLAGPAIAIDELADPPVVPQAPAAAQPIDAPAPVVPPQANPASDDSLPPPPMPADDREGIEPEVTIIRKADRTVEEYRVNGQLYMVKVTPSKGLSYYLVDADGDGNLETRQNELDPKMLVPSWVIFRW